MKAYLLPFIGAFVVFVFVFWALDITIMKLHGLELIYKH